MLRIILLQLLTTVIAALVAGMLGGLPALSSESGLDRPMEDAVADLLRPLLKTWLAENMPKIVERALRREMSERLLPGQKNPRT